MGLQGEKSSYFILLSKYQASVGDQISRDSKGTKRENKVKKNKRISLFQDYNVQLKALWVGFVKR